MGHGGIVALTAPFWNWNKTTILENNWLGVSLNRTILELKLLDKFKRLESIQSLNRTILELKLSKLPPGIRIIWCLNRTILELKLESALKEAAEMEALTAPFWNWNSWEDFITQGMDTP